MHRKCFLLIWLICCSLFLDNLQAQTIQVPVEKRNFSLEQLPTKKLDDTSGFKNLPFIDYPLWSLSSVAYNPLQNMYERVIDGSLTAAQFRTFANKNRLDTTYLVNQKLSMNKIYMVTAIDSKGIKHVVIDANNNGDFGDDRFYSFDLAKPGTQCAIDVKIEYYDGVKIKTGVVPMLFDPFTPNKTNPKELDLLFLKVFHNKVGQLKLDNQSYKIEIMFHNEIYNNAPFSIKVKQILSDTASMSSFTYSHADTLDFGYHSYSIAKYEDNMLTLKFLKKNTFSGAAVASLAPQIEETDIITNKAFSLKAQQGKYTFIDFWGSWCNPCIAALPELTSIYERFKSNIQFLSVAYDKTKNREKLRALITEHKMEWAQVFDDMEGNRGKIVKAYKVQEFPTSILIDPKGVVVLRALGASGLKDVEAYLAKKGIKGVE